MRIATWNLENLGLRHGNEEHFELRIATLRPMLERLDADILCLQEINAQQPHRRAKRSLAALDRLIASSRYEAFHRAHTTRANGEPLDIHNLVVLSRRPILESRQIRNELVPSWHWAPPGPPPGNAPAAKFSPVEVSWDRPALYLRIDDGTRAPLHLINLHLRASRAAPIVAGMPAAQNGSTDGWAMGFFLAAQKQIGQALEVRLTVDRLFDQQSEARILVCGDMNAEAHQMPVRLLRAAGEDTGLADSTTRALEALEERLPVARRFSVRHAGRPVMLDHMLASPELAARCTAVDVFNEELPDETLAGEEVAGSLHAALTADFA